MMEMFFFVYIYSFFLLCVCVKGGRQGEIVEAFVIFLVLDLGLGKGYLTLRGGKGFIPQLSSSSFLCTENHAHRFLILHYNYRFKSWLQFQVGVVYWRLQTVSLLSEKFPERVMNF